MEDAWPIAARRAQVPPPERTAFPMGAQQQAWGPTERGEWAAAATTQTRRLGAEPSDGPLCWACNKRGHVKRQCPQVRTQHGAGGRAASSGTSSVGNDAILAKLNELVDLLKQSKK